MDGLDTSWISTCGVCWETTRRVSGRLAEFHMTVNNLARPDTNLERITYIIIAWSPRPIIHLLSSEAQPKLFPL